MKQDRFSDDALRAAYRTLVDEAEDRGGPDADRIWDAVNGSSPVEERRAVVDEIARRPGAALFWRLARELQAEPEQPGAPAAAPRARTGVRRRVVKYAAWVAAAAALLVVGTWAMRPGPTETTGTPGYRDPDRGDQGPLRSEMADERPIDRGRFVLRWSPADSGAVYDVRVMTESLVEIADERGLTRPELIVPAAALGALASGSRILWQVTARLPSGAEVRSETFVSVIE